MILITVYECTAKASTELKYLSLITTQFCIAKYVLGCKHIPEKNTLVYYATEAQFIQLEPQMVDKVVKENPESNTLPYILRQKDVLQY